MLDQLQDPELERREPHLEDWHALEQAELQLLQPLPPEQVLFILNEHPEQLQ